MARGVGYQRQQKYTIHRKARLHLARFTKRGGSQPVFTRPPSCIPIRQRFEDSKTLPSICIGLAHTRHHARCRRTFTPAQGSIRPTLGELFGKLACPFLCDCLCCGVLGRLCPGLRGSDRFPASMQLSRKTQHFEPAAFASRLSLGWVACLPSCPYLAIVAYPCTPFPKLADQLHEARAFHLRPVKVIRTQGRRRAWGQSSRCAWAPTGWLLPCKASSSCCAGLCRVSSAGSGSTPGRGGGRRAERHERCEPHGESTGGFPHSIPLSLISHLSLSRHAACLAQHAVSPCGRRGFRFRTAFGSKPQVPRPALPRSRRWSIDSLASRWPDRSRTR